VTKKIVLPGEKVADGVQYSPNTYVEDNATYAAVIGTLDEENRFIPLEGTYRPLVGDNVVGVVIDSRHSGYEVELGLSQTAFISTRELRTKLELADFVVCKVREVDEVGGMDLTEIRRLPKGKLIDFPSAKVPRLIGKKSSMLMLLKDKVGDVVVGNNGVVWVSDKANIPLLFKAINLIRRKAHFSGLTDEVATLLG
jgi:exosome complex component RRP4